MKSLNWFNRDPKAPRAWLHNSGLQLGEVVLVDGRPYRYGTDRGGLDAVLTPADDPTTKRAVNGSGRALPARRALRHTP